MTSEADSWVSEAAETLSRALDEFVTGGGAPGAVAAVGAVGAPTEVVSAGIVAPECGRAAPDGDTRYDVASLTKMIATWPLVGHAFRTGVLDPDAPIGDQVAAAGIALPESVDLPGAGVTVRQLLSHTAGLIRPTRLDRYRGRPLVEAILAEPLDAEPGIVHRYLSRGYILLGLLLPGLLGRSLSEAADELVWRPAGMKHTGFGPIPAGPDVAPTERLHPDAPPQWGQAHDENARSLGGVAGHAGAFASATDLAAYAAWLLDPQAPLASWLEASLRPHAAVPQPPAGVPRSEGGEVGSGLTRGLGWLITDRRVAYHDGFTGVSLYLAPDLGRYLTVLSNAVYAGRVRTGLRRLRLHALDTMTMPPP